VNERGVYRRELVGAQYSGRDERRRLNGDIGAFSAQFTKAMLDKGYITHDPMFATDDTVLQDNLARAGLASHHGGVVPQSPLIDLFSNTWFPFVTDWRIFHDNVPEPAPEFIEKYRKQLDRLHATFNVLERAGVVAPHPMPSPASPSPRPQQPPARPPTIQPSTPPVDDAVTTETKVLIYGALALGGIIALAVATRKR
jgi:hypothetical protein